MKTQKNIKITAFWILFLFGINVLNAQTPTAPNKSAADKTYQDTTQIQSGNPGALNQHSDKTDRQDYNRDKGMAVDTSKGKGSKKTDRKPDTRSSSSDMYLQPNKNTKVQ